MSHKRLAFFFLNGCARIISLTSIKFIPIEIIRRAAKVFETPTYILAMISRRTIIILDLSWFRVEGIQQALVLYWFTERLKGGPI